MEPYRAALADTKYGSLWLDQDVRPDPLPSLAKDERCELLIVGGGFTGLWAALQAKERMPDCDIILIESTIIGDGASGRNGGTRPHKRTGPAQPEGTPREPGAVRHRRAL